MQKTIVILGNGFDIDLGWKTSYKEFVNSKFIAMMPKTPMLLDIIEKSNLENWIDLELELRNAIERWGKTGKEEKLAIEINLTWKILSKKIFEYIIDFDNKEGREIDKKSCAYLFRERVQDKMIYTFNYTNPFEDLGKESNFVRYVHGRYYHDEFRSDMMTLSQWNNMILGTDHDEIVDIIDNNSYLKPIIKRFRSKYPNVNLVENLCKSDLVIFFGHSFGITDSDYFKPFFKNVVDGKTNAKDITIITKNVQAANAIKLNTQSWGIDLTAINQYVPVSFVYTQNGMSDIDFVTLLSKIDYNQLVLMR